MDMLVPTHQKLSQGGGGGDTERELLCVYCDTVTVETEIHALLHCLKHNDRIKLYELIESKHRNDMLESQNREQLFIKVVKIETLYNTLLKYGGIGMFRR